MIKMLPYKACEKEKKIKVKTSPEMRTVGFRCTGGNDYYSARTGPIHCKNGFTVEVTLVRGWDGDDDWSSTYVALVAD